MYAHLLVRGRFYFCRVLRPASVGATRRLAGGPMKKARDFSRAFALLILGDPGSAVHHFATLMLHRIRDDA